MTLFNFNKLKLSFWFDFYEFSRAFKKKLAKTALKSLKTPKNTWFEKLT